jgi:hypothetical protein
MLESGQKTLVEPTRPHSLGVYGLITNFRENSHVAALLCNTGAADIADALGMTVRFGSQNEITVLAVL